MTADKYKIDMCHGAILPKLILFTVPIMAANVLQLIFHIIDLTVIGRFASGTALAAIGATSVVHTLIVTFFAGISVGTNVLVARYFGARDHHKLHLTIHTSLAFSLWGGIALTVAALALTRPLLILLETPPELLEKSTRYLQIIFLTLPLLLLYSIGSAILRGFGDSRRPLYFLIAGAGLKAVLNLFFVAVCRFDVIGVAVATVLSQTLMGWLVLRTLVRCEGASRLKWKQVRLESSSLKEILKLGVPASIQSSSYSVSNLLIQSSINSFGAYAIAGNTAAGALEGIINVGGVAFYMAAMSFTAQNHGAGHIDRVCRCILICMAAGAIISGGCGLIFAAFGEPLLGIFTSDPETIRMGMIRVRINYTLYFTAGVMEAVSGSLRGLGYSASSMVITVFGVCGLRVAWVLMVFPHFRSLACLYFSYPISWALVAVLNGILLWCICRKLLNGQRRKEAGQVRA